MSSPLLGDFRNAVKTVYPGTISSYANTVPAGRMVRLTKQGEGIVMFGDRQYLCCAVPNLRLPRDVIVERKALADQLSGVGPTNPVAVTVDGAYLHVKCASIDHRFPIADTKIPWEPPKPPVLTLTCPEGATADIIGVQKVASKDDTRPALTALQVEWYLNRPDQHLNAVVTVTATDSYRLHRVQFHAHLDDGDTPTQKGAVMLSARAMAKLPKVGETTFAFDGDRWEVSRGHVSLILSPVPGDYPDYSKIRPTEFEVETGLEPAVAGTIKQFAKSVQKNHALRTRLVAGTHAWLVSDLERSSRTAVGCRERIGLKDDMEIGFNPGFLAEAMEFTGGEKVSFVSPLRPIVAERTDERGKREALLMPVRLPS